MSILRLIHEGAEILEITGKQVRRPASQCRLENRLILERKTFWKRKTCPVTHKVDASGETGKILEG